MDAQLENLWNYRFFSRFGSATAVIMVAFSLSNKGFDSNRSHSGMIPMLDIEERQIRPPHSLSGSTTASIAEQPEDDEDSIKAKLRRYWLSDIDRDWTDILLIICGYISGLVEGLSFNYWGSFSNMQTGNIILLALGASDKPDNPEYLWIKALIAVGAFLLGNFCFVSCSRLLGPLRRVTIILSFAVQTILLLIAAVLCQIEAVNPNPDNDPTKWIKDIAIALMSFQAAGQIIASKYLAFTEIPTVVLTALMCDLFIDEKIFQRPWSSNPKRNRKIGFVLSLFAGALTAGGMAKGPGLASGLWLAMGMKAAITGALFFWKEKRQGKDVG